MTGLVAVRTVVLAAVLSVLAVLSASCSLSGGSENTGESPDAGASPSAPSASPSASVTPSGTPTSEPPPDPASFEAARAYRTVRFLAGRIGPREATTAAYARAADWVAGRLADWGYQVSQPAFRVPAGNSWGVTVPAGRTTNVVALPADFDPQQRYLIVGAHLDTVPQAPGAEDNASGTSVMLELARVAATERTRLPVVFVAFGAEEPRGTGDDWHHFGSQEYVAQMSPAERRNLVAMVSLDRVGVGSVVPVCGGGLTDEPVVRDLQRAARRADVPTFACEVNQSSDHWSFERAGLPAARLGSTAYAGYHNEGDVPSVVQPRQLKRVGELAWEFIAEQR